VKDTRGVKPTPVEVDADRIGPVVAVKDAVWIEHGNDLEYVVFPQLLSKPRLWCLQENGQEQKVEKAHAHGLGIGLTWVDARSYEHHRLFALFLVPDKDLRLLQTGVEVLRQVLLGLRLFVHAL